MEDFVDEDTGEVVSIERNDVIIDRESVLDSDNIELSWIQARKIFCCIVRTRICPTMLSYIIRSRKTRVTPRRKLCCISTDS